MKNFILRAITGILFVAILVGCILYGQLSFSILFAIVAALNILEFAQLVNKKVEIKISTVFTMLGGVYLFLAFFAYCSGWIGFIVFLPYLFLLMCLLVSELYLREIDPIGNCAYTMFSQAYIALPFALLNVLAFWHPETAMSGTYNYILPLSVFIFLWASDTGAYCIGSLIGKHKLFLRISPKKSWEGSIGGGLVAVGISFALSYFFPMLSTLEWIGLSLVIVVFGTWGDLIESLLKRQFGLKDSSNILPGHGGFLDRFDSSLLAIPAAVIYIYCISL